MPPLGDDVDLGGVVLFLFLERRLDLPVSVGVSSLRVSSIREFPLGFLGLFSLLLGGFIGMSHSLSISASTSAGFKLSINRPLAASVLF